MLVKAFTEDYKLKFRPHQVEGPASPRDYLDWNTRMRKWRLEQQNNKKVNHTTNGYDIPGLQVSLFLML
jgi:iron(II)-dependent oxidoreductase